jgi:hypothetical protein
MGLFFYWYFCVLKCTITLNFAENKKIAKVIKNFAYWATDNTDITDLHRLNMANLLHWSITDSILKVYYELGAGFLEKYMKMQCILNL